MPAKAPVTNAMTSYFNTVGTDHPSYLTREPLQRATQARQTARGARDAELL